jgi:hypothetical protein
VDGLSSDFLLDLSLFPFEFFSLLDNKKHMANKAVIFAILLVIFFSKGFVVFNAESLVLFTFTVFVVGMTIHFRESMLAYFSDNGLQIGKEFYSARANVKAYFVTSALYLRFKLALLSALLVGVAFCKHSAWSSLSCAKAGFEEELRVQVTEKFKRVAVYESLGVVSLQSSVVQSVPASITGSFDKKSTSAKETVLSDSISHLETA